MLGDQGASIALGPLRGAGERIACRGDRGDREPLELEARPRGSGGCGPGQIPGGRQRGSGAGGKKKKPANRS